jgi:hypothetical protein
LERQRRAPDAWRLASNALQSLRAIDPDDELACHKVEVELTAFLGDLRAEMARAAPTPENSGALAVRLFGFLDLAAVARTYLEYGTGELLAIMVEAFGLHLAASAVGAATWSACLDAFEGVSQIPLMTVHKSKGLE